MALPTDFETFFDSEAHGFAQRVNERDWGRVVIEAALPPIGHGSGDVEIPALHFCFTAGENFFCTRADGDGRHAWRRAERFLRAAEDDVETLLVHVHGNGGERGDSVHDEESVEFVANFTEAVKIGDDAGGG